MFFLRYRELSHQSSEENDMAKKTVALKKAAAPKKATKKVSKKK
jgi:hypothetical protein